MRIGIRSRMLAAGGSLITVVLVILWLGLLMSGRTFILDDLQQDTVELATTFSTFTLDALIEKDSGSGALMEMLDDAIFLSLRGATGIRRITVYDPSGTVIAGVPAPFPQQDHSDGLSVPDWGAPVTGIHNDPDLGWVAEAIIPLQTGSRIWGFLRFSSDARAARYKIQRLFFVLMGAILLASLSLLWITSALVSRLTGSLVDMADQMARLDPDTPEELRISAADYEIEVVEKSFNLLVRRLKASRRKLIETQRRMARADKLNSLALLSAGVAHEVNNPLNGVRNCLVAILKEPDNLELHREYLGLALEGLEQIENVIAKLVQYADPRAPESTEVNINRAVEAVLGLMSYRLARCDVSIRLMEGLPPVSGNRLQLQEALMNIVINALDAVGANDSITIETGSPRPGRVIVAVTNTGPAIPEAEKEQLFDPFFTTKGPGVGTGLGLSITLGIVEAHGGTIDVRSDDDDTTFTIDFPTV